MKKKEIITNSHGLDIEIEKEFVPDYNDWFIDEYNTAKLLIYKDATKLYPSEIEAEKIAYQISLMHLKGGGV